MSETLPLAEVKSKFSEMVDRVEHTHDRIVVTRNGRPAAVMISPEGTAAAIVECMLTALTDNPHGAGGPLQRELAGLHSARRGAYRVIYEIDDEKRRVTITNVQHRREVYRPQ